MSFEKYFIDNNGTPRISNNLLKSCFVLNLGIPSSFTGAMAKSEIEGFLGRQINESSVTLSTQETADIVNIITWINAGLDLAIKLMRKELFWALLDNIEEGTVYTTESEIRAGVSVITNNTVTWSEDT